MLSACGDVHDEILDASCIPGVAGYCVGFVCRGRVGVHLLGAEGKAAGFARCLLLNVCGRAMGGSLLDLFVDSGNLRCLWTGLDRL